MSILADLKRVRELLADEASWTKGEYFIGYYDRIQPVCALVEEERADQDELDDLALLVTQEAQCMCILGAVCKATSTPPTKHLRYTASSAGVVAYLERAMQCLGPDGKPLGKWYTCVPEFNDSTHTTHADVLALVDAAITLAEAESAS